MSGVTKVIRLTVNLTVDEDAWCESYGIFPSILRHDVRQYVETALLDSAAAGEGLFERVEVK